MSELAVGGPLTEADLCDELGPYPVHTLPRHTVRVGDRGNRLLEGAEESREPGQLALVESLTHLADEQ